MPGLFLIVSLAATCGPGVLLHRACIKAPTSHADTNRPACYIACLAWASIGRLVVCTVCTFLHVCVRSCMFMDMLDMLSWLCWICWGCLGKDSVVQCAAYMCSCCSHCMVSAHLALVEVGAPNCTCILVHMCWAGLHLAGVLCSSGVLLIWSAAHLEQHTLDWSSHSGLFPCDHDTALVDDPQILCAYSCVTCACVCLVPVLCSACVGWVS